MKPRRLKCAVGRCQVCDSDAVISISGKYVDKKHYFSVVCSNVDCGKRTPGYKTEAAAIAAWNSTWQKERKVV